MNKPLPIEALPAMDRLMSYFNLAVKEAIKLYQDSRNRQEFEQTFLKFDQDLESFEQSYSDWLNDDHLSKEQQEQMNDLRAKLTEAKDLLLLARRFITH